MIAGALFSQLINDNITEFVQKICRYADWQIVHSSQGAIPSEIFGIGFEASSLFLPGGFM